jgi:hypothetical protein
MLELARRPAPGRAAGAVTTPAPWHLPTITAGLASVLARLEAELRLEQAPHGLDSFDERAFQRAFAAGLRDEHEVALEVHYPSSSRLGRTCRQRCDLVLTPRGWPLRQDETLPLDLCPPEAGLWLELKIARQLREGGATNGGYGTQWRRQVVADLRKMAAEPSIREAALVVLVFTADATGLGRDLAAFESLLTRDGVGAGFRQVRSLPIADRIGHRLLTVALWPTVQRGGNGDAGQPGGFSIGPGT